MCCYFILYEILFCNIKEDKSKSKIISPFHDIPLLANEKDKIYNMVVEIPRWTSTKFEVNKNIFFYFIYII